MVDFFGDFIKIGEVIFSVGLDMLSIMFIFFISFFLVWIFLMMSLGFVLNSFFKFKFIGLMKFK